MRIVSPKRQTERREAFIAVTSVLTGGLLIQGILLIKGSKFANQGARGDMEKFNVGKVRPARRSLTTKHYFRLFREEISQ